MGDTMKIYLFAFLFFLCGFQAIGQSYIEGEVIIKTKDGVYPKGLKVIKNLGHSTYLVKLNKKIKVIDAVEYLKGTKDVIYAEPNFVFKKIGNKSSDPMQGELWALNNSGQVVEGIKGKVGIDISASEAWKVSKGSKEIVIAVLDTGIDYNHPDLKSNMWVNKSEANGQPGVDDDGNGFIDDIHGFNFVKNNGKPMDDNGHGSHCAGTIGAKHGNGVGIKGVMQKVSLMALKFLDESGSGTTDQAISAINYAVKMKVDIMSNSWGGGAASLALEEAISRAEKAGIYFVAAAGNTGLNNDNYAHYPSSYELDNIIAVGAHDSQDQISVFSCYGKSSVDLMAPGSHILSTTPNNSYANFSGTSMATPHVSASIGLYLALNGKSQNYKNVKEKLLKSSVYSEAYAYKSLSGGRLNVYNFLTDYFPERPLDPDQEAWLDLKIDSFESAHPYTRNNNLNRKIFVKGAKFIRVKIKKLDTEEDYDYLSIINEQGQELERISGTKSNFYSVPVLGDTVVIEFQSDSSVQKWGFYIDQIQYIL